jgi:hypothetical protein
VPGTSGVSRLTARGDGAVMPEHSGVIPTSNYENMLLWLRWN